VSKRGDPKCWFLNTIRRHAAAVVAPARRRGRATFTGAWRLQLNLARANGDSGWVTFTASA
jgi:hypothetical protein